MVLVGKVVADVLADANADKEQALKIVVAKQATSLPTTTMLPPKSVSSQEAQRRLAEGIKLWESTPGFLRGRKDVRRLNENTNIIDESKFDALSDYNLHPKATQVVAEEAAEILNLVNQIGCSTRQVRGYDVGLNKECNPDNKAYVAIVDDKECGAEDNTFSTWYLQMEGPDDLGDGEYVMEALLKWQGQLNVAAQLTGRVENGVLVDSHINFMSTEGDFEGYLFQSIDTEAKSTYITYYERKTSQPTAFTYLVAEYSTDDDDTNPESGSGSALSGCTGGYCDDDYSYKLVFKDDFILKRKITSDGNGGNINTDTCIDYAGDNMIVENADYTMFWANGELAGKQLEHLSGVPLKMDVQGYDQPVEAWVSFHGIYGLGYDGDLDENMPGDARDPDTIADFFENGATVQKVIQVGDDIDKDYTLNTANAILVKVEKSTVPISDLEGLPLTVSQGEYEGTQFHWDGSSFKLTGKKAYACLSLDNQGYVYKPTAEPAFSYNDCVCLGEAVDGVYPINTSGQQTSTYENIGIMEYDLLVTSNEDVSMHARDFPNGVPVKAGDVHGYLEFEYSRVQNLYFFDGHTVNKGDTITQAGGVEGIVYESTPYTMTNVVCASCVSYQFEGPDCGGSGGVIISDGFLLEGLTLTQGSTTAVVSSYSSGNDISFHYLENGPFNLNDPILVSMGDYFKDMDDLHQVSGSITIDSTSTIIQESHMISVVLAEDAPYFSLDSDVTVGSVTETPYNSLLRDGEITDISTAELTYYKQVIIGPGDTVPDLICYEDCPDFNPSGSGADPNALEECTSASGCSYENSYSIITNMVISQPGSCHVDSIPDIVISNVSSFTEDDLDFTIEVDPTKEEYVRLTGISFSDNEVRGSFCEGATINFTGGTCDTYPEVTVYCGENGEDTLNADHGHFYAFDASVGMITNLVQEVTQESAPSEYQLDFGWFFEATDENAEKVKCSWNDQILCPRSAFHNLDVSYRYITGGSAKRIALAVGTAAEVLKAPQLFTYQHTAGTSSNSGTNYYGSSFFVEYENGEIRGLPQVCFNALGERMSCTPDAATQLNDINIPHNAVLHAVGGGSVDGEQFVTLPSNINEYFPVLPDLTGCAALSVDDIPYGIPSSFDEYTAPDYAGENIPTGADLASFLENFALGGFPLAYGGDALYELSGTGQCEL